MRTEELQEALREIVRLDFFKAEVALEEDLIAGFLKKMETLDLDKQTLKLHYAQLKGAISAIRQLQARRSELIKK